MNRNIIKAPRKRSRCNLCGGQPIAVTVVSQISAVCLDEPCVAKVMGSAYDGGPPKKEDNHDTHRPTHQAGGVLAHLITTGPPPRAPSLREAVYSAYRPCGKPGHQSPADERARPRLADKVTHLGWLTAWRLWVLRRSTLLTLVEKEAWLGRKPFHAVCIQMVHKTTTPFPVWRCSCGIHASTPDSLKLQIDQPHPAWQGETLVLGTVALWGNVIRHRQGYRAQYAYPLCLYAEWAGRNFRPLDKGVSKRLTRRYGVEISTPEAAARLLLASAES